MQTNALSRGKMQVALLAEPKTPLLWNRACLYHSGGVGQDHMCAIIADSLMSNEMCGGFFVHTHHEALLCNCTVYVSAIRYTCAYKFTARVKSRA